MLVPVVIESTSKGERSWDIFSRLHKERIIILGSAVDDNVANVICAQMLHLESEDPEKPITLIIQSPGGWVSAGLAIHDVMQYVKCPVHTIVMGMAASMGAFLLAAGKKGERIALANAEIMIHQPSGGAQGMASDMVIQVEQIKKLKKKLNELLSKYTGRSIEEVEKATDRDTYMSAEEALAFGLIDKIITERQ